MSWEGWSQRSQDSGSQATRRYISNSSSFSIILFKAKRPKRTFLKKDVNVIYTTLSMFPLYPISKYFFSCWTKPYCWCSYSLTKINYFFCTDNSLGSYEKTYETLEIIRRGGISSSNKLFIKVTLGWYMVYDLPASKSSFTYQTFFCCFWFAKHVGPLELFAFLVATAV